MNNKQIGNYHWYYMGNRGLGHSVYCNKTCVIPAGTKYVGIAFRQSHLTRVDENGKTQRLNVYRVQSRNPETGRWDVKLYHA